MNTSERAASYLEGAANLIEESGALARGKFARDERGVAIPNYASASVKPACFCVYGAISRVANDDREHLTGEWRPAFALAVSTLATDVRTDHTDLDLTAIASWSDSLTSHVEAVIQLRSVATKIRVNENNKEEVQLP